MTKFDLLREYHRMELANILAYSTNYAMTKAKPGYESEWELTKEKIALLEKMMSVAENPYMEQLYANVPESIRALRRKAGMTQKELANTVGVSAQTILRYEKGKMSPSATELSKIKNALCLKLGVGV